MGKKSLQFSGYYSYADLFSLAAYQCLQQETMSVNEQRPNQSSMSNILAITLFQAWHDTAIASSKILKDHSSQELRNASINSQQLFDSKVKEAAKSNLEAQQNRFLASFANNINLQQQKSSYSATGPFKKNLDRRQSF